MSKVKSITVSNLKAVALQTANFDGYTAIVTGKNNGGKTSFLRGLFDRVRGIKADKVIKDGQDEGFAEAILTTGEKLKWEFSNKGEKGFREKLTYITDKDVKTPLTTALRDRFFPATFDVDKFLQSPPAAQRKVLQDLAGLDFTDIDARYKKSYDARTAANTLAYDAKVKFEGAAVVPEVKAIELQPLLDEKETVRVELNNLYLKNKKVNDDARTAHQSLLTEHDNKVKEWKILQINREQSIVACLGALSVLKQDGYIGLEVEAYIKSKPVAEITHEFIAPIEPLYPDPLPDNTPLTVIESKIEAAHLQNTEAAKYQAWLQLRKNKVNAAIAAIDADKSVKAIEQERMDLIKTAKMPEGFTFTDEGIAYNGLAFTRDQLSSSAVYIAALKLASMRVGEVRCLHFDASFLDNNSLAEIEAWAQGEDLQLLIEMPDRAGGEIAYELIMPVE